MIRKYLYRLEFPNGKIYLGITVNPKRRWSRYYSKSKEPERVVDFAVRKFGYENVRMVLLVCGSVQYITSLEEKAIAHWNSRDPSIGYNVALGGKSSIASAEATRKKMSESQKKRIRTPEEIEKMTRSLKGRVFTKEHRAKLSRAGRSRVIPTSTRLKISQANSTPRAIERNRLIHCGRTRTLETRMKIAAARSKQVITLDTRVKMKKYWSGITTMLNSFKALAGVV